MKLSSVLGLGALAGLCSSAALGCQSDEGFAGCEKTRDCADGGSSGSAGEAGESGVGGTETASGGSGGSGTGGAAGDGFGGSSGSGVEPECVEDADCDDELFCNGAEACNDDGECEDGSAPCSNPDAVHCDVVCTESDDEAECLVSPRDADGDGYGTPLCEEAPGDDCDDTLDTVHPEAEELCDGLDNDCDRNFDLSEGLPLSGSTIALDTNVAAAWPGIAWSTELERLAVAFSRNNAHSMILADASGTGVGSRDWTGITSSAHSVAAGSSGFGWNHDDGFRLIVLQGVNPIDDGSSGAAPGGRSVWDPDSSAWILSDPSVSDLGASSGASVPIPVAAVGPTALTLSGGSIQYLRTTNGGSVYFGKTMRNGSATAAVQLNGIDIPGGTDPELFVTETGFAAFWKPSPTSMTMMELDTDGQPVCGPVNLPSLENSNTAYDGKSFVHLAQGGAGFKISRFLPGCNVRNDTTDVPLGERRVISGGDITATEQGFAMTWVDCGNANCTGAGTPILQLRLLSEKICQ